MPQGDTDPQGFQMLKAREKQAVLLLVQLPVPGVGKVGKSAGDRQAVPRPAQLLRQRLQLLRFHTDAVQAGVYFNM